MTSRMERILRKQVCQRYLKYRKQREEWKIWIKHGTEHDSVNLQYYKESLMRNKQAHEDLFK